MTDHSGEEHKAIHVVLHKHLDELVANFILCNSDKRLSNTTLMEFLQWSAGQTTEPTLHD